MKIARILTQVARALGPPVFLLVVFSSLAAVLLPTTPSEIWYLVGLASAVLFVADKWKE